MKMKYDACNPLMCRYVATMSLYLLGCDYLDELKSMADWLGRDLEADLEEHRSYMLTH